MAELGLFSQLDSQSETVPKSEADSSIVVFDAANPDHRALLRLAMADGIGPIMRQGLLDCFETPAKIFEASPAQWAQVSGIGPKRAQAMRDVSENDIDKMLAFCRLHRIELIPLLSPLYPKQLKTIDDAPGILFSKGSFAPEDGIAVGIVGTRHASNYGRKQARQLGYALAQAGITVVSGLARGVDTEAHRGALDGGGRTVAVLACGLESVYPPENESLATDICKSGAVVSECCPGSPAQRGMFPQRNRIISGLSLGVVVVEADNNSGALITARHAYEQNREVFAVPGQVDSRLSRGCNRLIKDGAKLVQTVDDILENLGPMAHPVVKNDGVVLKAPPKPAELKLNDMERKILELIDQIGGQVPIDLIIEQSQLPPHNVLVALTALEFRRLIHRIAGQAVARS